MGTYKVKRPTSTYTILEKEDPEDVAHRRAQWLIDKVLEQADGARQRSNMGVRIRRLRIWLGRRFRRLRKSVQLSTLSAIKARVYRRAAEQLKAWRQMLRRKEEAAAVGVPLPLSLLN